MSKSEGRSGPRLSQTQLQESADALKTVRSWLLGPEKLVLQAWLSHFDVDHDMRISFSEFCHGMAKLDYRGNSRDLFFACDTDESGFLTLDEIDEESASIWNNFNTFCVEQFASAKDMISSLTTSRSHSSKLSREDFVSSIKKRGWTHGYEELLFKIVDKDNHGSIQPDHLKWLDEEKKQQMRKEEAKLKSQKDQAKRQKDKQRAALALKEFKMFLKNKFSSMLRAWRKLDSDSSLSIQKAELFKGCKEIGWSGDIRSLWKSLDKDSSGVTTLEEIDIRTAVQLAEFKDFCKHKFGSAVEAFRAFDQSSASRLKEREFLEACKHHGFHGANKGLFQGLDSHVRKHIMESDIKFVDQWRPPPYLSAKPSEKDAQKFKALLLKVYNNYIKAWRSCLDRDSSNMVCWGEFDIASKKIKFTGDVAAAWRYFDNDFSGFITLQEIDKESYDVLVEFKTWANEEFGSVRQAFEAFDADKSREVTSKEFRRCCGRYGYSGSARTLFDCLDADCQGCLSLTEVVFLDEWDIASNIPERLLELKEDDEQRKKSPKGILGIVRLQDKIVDRARIEKLALPKIVPKTTTTYSEFHFAESPFPSTSRASSVMRSAAGSPVRTESQFSSYADPPWQPWPEITHSARRRTQSEFRSAPIVPQYVPSSGSQTSRTGTNFRAQKFVRVVNTCKDSAEDNQIQTDTSCAREKSDIPRLPDVNEKLPIISESSLSVKIQMPSAPYKWTARASRKRMAAQLEYKRPFLGL